MVKKQQKLVSIVQYIKAMDNVIAKYGNEDIQETFIALIEEATKYKIKEKDD